MWKKNIVIYVSGAAGDIRGYFGMDIDHNGLYDFMIMVYQGRGNCYHISNIFIGVTNGY
jgi:hypothetical protein